MAIPIAQPFLFLPPGLKALRSLFLSSPPAVPVGAIFWVMSSHNSLRKAATQPHRLQDFTSSFLSSDTSVNPFKKNLGASFGVQIYSDLIKIWLNTLNSSSPSFYFCLHVCQSWFFNSYFFFLPDITFKLCTNHLPPFSVLSIILRLFTRNSANKPQPK